VRVVALPEAEDRPEDSLRTEEPRVPASLLDEAELRTVDSLPLRDDERDSEAPRYALRSREDPLLL
jgi:hypothetical protein